MGVRSGSIRALSRTQESVALSADGDSWFLLNASPEVRQQLESFPRLHPRSLRDTPLAGVVLTNGDLDHCLGLLSLRESQRLVAYATEPVRRDFVEHNSFARTLQRFDGQFTWRALRLGAEEPLRRADGADSGLSVTAFPVLGKPPLHAGRAPEAEDNVGLRIEDRRSGAVLAYISGIGGPSPALDALTRGARAVFFDGTFWSNDELVRLGVVTRSARDMSHWPLGDADGSLAYLERLAVPRRILIHVNNSNPILREDSAERRVLDAAGIEVAFDGMELSL
jgi:pyrroloquinoline quinone biosynthesis protein B